VARAAGWEAERQAVGDPAAAEEARARAADTPEGWAACRCSRYSRSCTDS